MTLPSRSTLFSSVALVSYLLATTISLLSRPSTAGASAALGSSLSSRVACAVSSVSVRYVAEYSPGSGRQPVPTLTVVFYSTRPTSAQAETVLRACIDVAVKTFHVEGEMLANAWFSRTGSQADEEGPLPLKDGSRHLSFDPKTGRVRTWNEREGVRPSVAENPDQHYVVEYREDKVLVPPYGKFATLEVLFEQRPSEAAMYEILVTEIVKAVTKQQVRISTSAYAKTGPRNDPASKRQIRGSSGRYIFAEFNPKDGKIRDENGRQIGTVR